MGNSAAAPKKKTLQSLGGLGMKERFRAAGVLFVLVVSFFIRPAHIEAGGPHSDQLASRSKKLQNDIRGKIPKKSEKSRRRFAEGELLVKFKGGINAFKKREVHQKHGASKIREFMKGRIHHVKLPPGINVKKAVEQYQAHPEIEYAEPDYLVEIKRMPSEPSFSDLWGLHNTGQNGGVPGADVDAPAAWDLTTGSGNVVVAIIDTGVDYNHPDLKANMWRNEAEYAGVPGKDDDANGIIDDIYGIDTNYWNGYDGDPFDDHGHGTHVAGTIGAVGLNHIGVAGMNWNVGIMACKFIADDGIGKTSGAIACLEYIKAMRDRGVNVIATNNSWGGGGYSQALSDAINAQQEILFVAAAGNDAVDTDAAASYPSSYNLPNIISVAATNNRDERADFSNYGRTTVDVGAPGEAILSTLPDQNYWSIQGGYGYLSGTSMATPHVTGLTALIKSDDMSRTWKDIKNLILSTGDDISALSEKTVTGKRIKARAALTCTNQPMIKLAGASEDFPIQAGTTATISVLSVNCESPAGPVTAATSGGENFDLFDDGIAPDLAAGDGVFTASWTGTIDASYITFSSPSGSFTAPHLYVKTGYIIEGNTNASYYQKLRASDIIRPLNWTIPSGNLPGGLILNGATGEITGKPTTVGSFNFTIQASDDLNRVGNRDFSLSVVDELLVESWADSYGLTYRDVPADVAADHKGNRFVTGFTVNPQTGSEDFLTLKYDSTNSLVWARTYDAGGDEWASAVAADSMGNVYVTGGCPYFYCDADYITLKYNPGGNLLWERTYDSGQLDGPLGIAVDSHDDVYVTGHIIKEAFHEDVLTIKYGADGDLAWTRIYSAMDINRGAGIAVDQNDNIYVSGYAGDDVCDATGCWILRYDFLTLKYDTSGNMQPGWPRTDGLSNTFYTGKDVAVGSSGNVYVVGDWGGGLISYTPAGGFRWQSPSIYNNGMAESVAVDSNENIYVAGSYFNAASGNRIYFITKYDSSGTELSTRILQNESAVANTAVAVDDSDALFLSRRLPVDGGVNDDFVVSRYVHMTVGEPDISSSVKSYDFGPVEIGASDNQHFSILNSGTTGLSITSILITGADASMFTPAVDTCTGNVIAPLASCLIEVTFSPNAESSMSSNLNIASNDPDTPSLDITLTGSGYTPVTPVPLLEVDDVSVKEDGGTAIFTVTLSGSPAGPVTVDYATGGGTATAGSDYYSVQGTLTFNMGETTRTVPVDIIEDAVSEGRETVDFVLSNPTGGAALGTKSSGMLSIIDNDLIMKIDTSSSFSVATRADGSVWAWGQNFYGQLGNGTLNNSSVPVQVEEIEDVSDISAGSDHVLALRNDGTVWAWGRNDYGQLGNGGSMNSPIPVQTSGLSNVVAVSAGFFQSLALKSDGTVWAWGYNEYGQVGDGSTTDRSNPVKVSNLTNVIAISAGSSHSMALKDDGTVWAWGYGGNGRLGNDGTNNSSVPVAVIFPEFEVGTYVMGIAGGGSHSLALVNDGTVLAWGDNHDGQVGDGTNYNSRLKPVLVSSISGVTAIAAGSSHSLAIGSDGTAWAWGSNTHGQIGDGSSANVLTPVQVSTLANVVAAAGGVSHSLALLADGSVYAWGYNWYGQLGTAGTALPGEAVTVYGLTGVIMASAGGEHSLAVKTDGTVWAWGRNDKGQLGDGTTTDSPFPVQVPGLTNVIEVAGGGWHSLALKNNGTVWAWGRNGSGQLGDGSTADCSSPLQVPGLTNVVSVSAGSYHSFALQSDGTLRAWGGNWSGQLGDGTTTDRHAPVRITSLPNVSSIAAGVNHSVAVKTNGTVWAWGYNWYGQLGNGNTNDRHAPVQVPGLSGFMAVSAGSSHSLAVALDGTSWAWGDNTSGQLGDGTTTGRLTPVQVFGLSQVVSIAAGESYSAAVRADGTLLEWGSGQKRPDEIPEVNDAVAVTSRTTHNLAVKTDGTIRAWGSNQYGQLGNGTSFATPRQSLINLKSDICSASFDAAAYTVSEDSGAVRIRVTRSAGCSGTVTVDYGTQGLTASGGEDYTETIGTIVFLDNETEKEFTVAVNEDTLPEPDETFELMLQNPTGQMILGADYATVNILDNDGTLTIAVDGDGSGTVTSSPAGISCGSDCTEVMAGGTSVQLTATPAPGSALASWSGAGCIGSGTCGFVISGDVYVTATFRPDGDGDGVVNIIDNCLTAPNANQADYDLDGVGDACDTCPTVKNPTNQTDTDADGVGDACEPYIAVSMGPDRDNVSQIRIMDLTPSESVAFSFTAFDAASVGYGARLAMGDVDGDDMYEVIVAKGEGVVNNAEIKVYEVDGTPLSGANQVAFSAVHRNGSRVASGDFDGNGVDEIVVGTSGNQALVRILSYNASSASLINTGVVLNAFTGTHGGVNVAVGDLDGDGYDELVTSPAAKHDTPEIKAWSVNASGGVGAWTVQPFSSATFLLPSSGITLPVASGGGAAIAAAQGMIAVGTGANGGIVELYKGSQVYDCRIDLSNTTTRQKSGIELAITDINTDGNKEVLISLGGSSGSDTRIYVYNDDCTYNSELTPVFPGSMYGARTAGISR